MAPKKSKPDLPETAVTEEQQAAMDTSQRLQQLAKEQGMLSSTQRIVNKEAPYPKALRKADEKDLVKKSSQRKGRYMLNICAQIAPAAAGKLGRLKFFGTIVFPNSKYMLLKFGSKDVLCEDIFENMIVFPEAHWIGTKDENPSEQQLLMPAELQSAVQHTKYSFATDASQLATQPSQPEQEAAAGSDEEDEDQEAGPSQSQGRRASGRLQGNKRPRYAEGGVSDEELHATDSNDEEEPVKKLPKLSQQGSPGTSKQQRHKSLGVLESDGIPAVQQHQGKSRVNPTHATQKRTDGSPADSRDSDELPSLAVRKGKSTARQGTLTHLLTNVTSQRKIKDVGRKAAGKATAASEVIDLLDDDDDDQAAVMHTQDTIGSMQPASAVRPRRARASLAQSLKESSSEDDEVQSVETVESAPPSEDSDDDYE